MNTNDLKKRFAYFPDCGGLYHKQRSRGIRIGDRAGAASGRRSVCFQGKNYQVARIAWFLTHNEWPDVVHHKNEDPSDDRLCNLQGMTYGEHVTHHSQINMDRRINAFVDQL